MQNMWSQNCTNRKTKRFTGIKVQKLMQSKQNQRRLFTQSIDRKCVKKQSSQAYNSKTKLLTGSSITFLSITCRLCPISNQGAQACFRSSPKARQKLSPCTLSNKCWKDTIIALIAQSSVCWHHKLICSNNSIRDKPKRIWLPALKRHHYKFKASSSISQILLWYLTHFSMSVGAVTKVLKQNKPELALFYVILFIPPQSIKDSPIGEDAN